jgi:hypothetical protein
LGAITVAPFMPTIASAATVAIRPMSDLRHGCRASLRSGRLTPARNRRVTAGPTRVHVPAGDALPALEDGGDLLGRAAGDNPAAIAALAAEIRA